MSEYQPQVLHGTASLKNTSIYEDQEINLLQIFAILLAKRTFIITVTSICTLIAAIISFIIPSKYSVQTILSAPSMIETQKLYLNTDIRLTNPQLFAKFSKRLSSQGNIMQFLESSGLIKEELKQLKINNQEKSRRKIAKTLYSQYKISYIHHRIEDTKDNFNDNSKEVILTTYDCRSDADTKNNRNYIAYTNQQTLSSLVKEQRANVKLKIKKLEEQLAMDIAKESLKRALLIKKFEDEQALKLAKINNEIKTLTDRDSRDRQLQLQELRYALKIATALGMEHPRQPQAMSDKSLMIEINSNRHDLYLYGIIYLKNAIKMLESKEHTLGYYKQRSVLQQKIDIIKNDPTIYALKNRNDDTPYIVGIQAKKIELNRLKSLTFDSSNMTLFRFDSEPSVDTVSVKRSLIILLSLVASAFLASVIVLFRQALGAAST